MADFDYERLADLIVDRLIKKQLEYDREQEQSEHQIAELARLETLIGLYEQQEKYEQAAMVMRKLQNLRARLIKKGVIDS
jgi:hypothetical protein